MNMEIYIGRRLRWSIGGIQFVELCNAFLMAFLSLPRVGQLMHFHNNNGISWMIQLILRSSSDTWASIEWFMSNLKPPALWFKIKYSLARIRDESGWFRTRLSRRLDALHFRVRQKSPAYKPSPWSSIRDCIWSLQCNGFTSNWLSIRSYIFI